MNIPVPVRFAMMQAMVRRPPENTLLRGALGEEGQNKLPRPAELVTAMSEIPVVACRDSEHPDGIGGGKPSQERKRRRRPPNSQQACVKQHEEENRPELVFHFDH